MLHQRYIFETLKPEGSELRGGFRNAAALERLRRGNGITYSQIGAFSK